MRYFYLFMPFLALGACAYQVTPAAVGNLNVHQSYDEKLPGQYALIVDSDSFNEVVRVTGFQCSAHSFPLDARESFETGVQTVLSQVFENIEVVNNPMAASALSEAGYAGQIRVRSDAFENRIRFIPGFWTVSALADSEVSASINIDGPGGRLFGSTAVGDANAESDGGSACSGGAEALAESSRKALRELLALMAERIANSRRLREASGSQSTDS